MISKLLTYQSNTLDPYFNLATEKKLFDTLPEDSVILYIWQNNNTVVIGKNQNPWTECNCLLIEKDGAKIARRLSGGGAVFHDLGNLNFTFICQSENYDLKKQLGVIIHACSLAGIKAELSGRNDILADGRKFSGNAFYNSKGRCYHHGTLLISTNREKMSRYLTPDTDKLHSKGVRSVNSRIVNLTELSEDLTTQKMAEHLKTAFSIEYSLPLSQCSRPNEGEVSLLAAEYSGWEYIYGKTFPFSLETKDRFKWGGAELKLDTENGIIKSAQLYTDSMDHSLSDNVREALSGVRLSRDDLERALNAHLSPEVAEDIFHLIHKTL